MKALVADLQSPKATSDITAALAGKKDCDAIALANNQ